MKFKKSNNIPSRYIYIWLEDVHLLDEDLKIKG